MYVTVRSLPRPSRFDGGRNVLSRRQIPAAVLAFGFVSLLTDVSSEAVAAVLPLYITAVLGMGPLAYGFIDGIYQGVSAAVRILGGWWSDSTRRPKWVAFVGYLASALSRIGLLLATGFAGITAAIAVDRLGKGLRTGPRDSLIATASDPADLGRNFGVHRAMDTVGALAGPLLAFAVLATIPLGLGGYRAVFVFSLAFAILGLIVLVLAVPDLRTARGRASASDPTNDHAIDRSSQRRMALRLSDLSQPALRRVLVVAGLLGLVTVGDGFIYLSLSEAGSLGAKYFPLLFVGTNAAYMALAIPFGRVADRIGRARVFLTGHIALLAVYALTASGLAVGVWSVTIALLLMGSFFAATDGVLSALATQSVPEESRASGIAAAQTVVALTRFACSVGFGLLWQLTGRETALWVMAAALAVSLGGAGLLLRPLLPSKSGGLT
jgi:MFS family permease